MRNPSSRHPLSSRYPRVVFHARWLIVIVWLLGAGAATIALPKAQTSAGDLGGLVPSGSPAVRAEVESATRFSIPLLTNTAVVLHAPKGIPPLSQADVVLYALAVDQRLSHLHQPYPEHQVLGALPLLNTGGVLPGSHHTGTTAITYLYFSPKTSLAERRHLAHAYADHFRNHAGVRVSITGSAPARASESDVLTSHLSLIEIVTLAFVMIIVAATFRSLVAPIVLLGSAFLSYFLGIRLLGLLGEHMQLALPSALEPLIVALVLGILTDYCVFFLSGLRDRIREDKDPRDAFALSVRRNAPIVAVAGLTVAAGTASLYAARVQMYRAFGPGLAISVAVAALAAVTFFPAMMAILGRHILWPWYPTSADKAPRDRRPSWLVRLASHRFGAAIVAAACVGGLGVAAYPLVNLRLDLSFINGLPGDAPVQQGAQLAARGFPRGVLAPTVVLVRGPGVASKASALRELGQRMAHRPGIAGVLGPGSFPVPIPGIAGVFTAAKHDEARYVLYFGDPPLGGRAVDDLRGLQDQMPHLLRESGVAPARWQFAGDTALASETAAQTTTNLWLILGVAFAAEYLILAVFLRALVAPLLLLASSSLVIAAALGLTTALFQGLLGWDGLTFYVPFATSVLLVSLGSDYNVFGAGRIWEDAEDHPLRRAIRTALPETSRAITNAGFILAGSFAVVALIPLRAFREMAFTMFVGLLLDTFVVRSLLTPSLLTLVGPASGWPGHRLLSRHRERVRTQAAAPAVAGPQP